jgi:hypothetical protein
MLTRILLDPESETAGTETKAEEKAAVAETKAVIDPNKVTLTRAEHDALLAEVTGFRTKAADEEKARREAEEAKALKEKDFDKILKNRDADVTAAQKRADEKDAENRRILDTAARASATRDLMAALPGNLADDDAKAQLLSLLGPQVEAKLDGDNFTTKARDGRSLADFVKAELAKPGYAKFLAAKTTGGAGANGSTANPSGSNESRPRTLGHAWAETIRSTRVEGGGAAFASKFLSN